MVEQLLYLPQDDGTAPFAYMYQREDGGEQTHAKFLPRTVKVKDGRAETSSLSLDMQGVALVPHHTMLSTVDFYERPGMIYESYYEEMRALVIWPVSSDLASPATNPVENTLHNSEYHEPSCSAGIW